MGTDAAIPAFSVVIPTFNRSESLERTLQSVLRQDVDRPYEVIVVDNASTDDTAAVVARYCATDSRLRYAREDVRGPSAARNTGVALSTAALIAFTDDDICPAATWLRALGAAAVSRPEVDCFGGRILPVWSSPPPGWLTRQHWTGALALQDYGEEPFTIGSARPLSLATANLAIRAAAFHAFGGFSPTYLFAEDTELLVRMWRAGNCAMYVPDAVVSATVPPDRMTKAYHRRWHRRNAAWTARMHLDESFDAAGHLLPAPVETSTLLGAPGFLYRTLAVHALGCLHATLTRRGSDAFHHEKQFWQAAGYIHACATDPRRTHPRGRAVEAAAFLAHVCRRAGLKLRTTVLH